VVSSLGLMEISFEWCRIKLGSMARQLAEVEQEAV